MVLYIFVYFLIILNGISIMICFLTRQFSPITIILTCKAVFTAHFDERAGTKPHKNIYEPTYNKRIFKSIH